VTRFQNIKAEILANDEVFALIQSSVQKNRALIQIYGRRAARRLGCRSNVADGKCSGIFVSKYVDVRISARGWRGVDEKARS